MSKADVKVLVIMLFCLVGVMVCYGLGSIVGIGFVIVACTVVSFLPPHDAE